MTRLVRPVLERLEDRTVPATWGNPWPDALHLTLSLAPDGTPVGNSLSSLFARLNAVAPSRAWQLEILRAFQTWAVNANINIGIIADGGQPFGAQGAPEGDPRFGDIRLAAVPLAVDVTGQAAPFEATAGTGSGDVQLNSKASFGMGGQGQYDLFTVLLHEAGHVFGLDHSGDPASVMYDTYLGPRTGLSTADIANLQALYGPRSPDAFEGASGNDKLATATPLNLLTNADGSLAVNVTADVTTPRDRDVYRFTAPLQVGDLVVQLQTAGLSLLAPRLTVYDAAGNVLATGLSTDPLGGGLTLRVPGLKALATYYVQVGSGRSDVFGVGGYGLTLSYLPSLVGPLAGMLSGTLGTTTSALTNTLVYDDLHTDDSFATALNLQQLVTPGDARFDTAFRGRIRDSSDVDYYRVNVPAAPTTTVVLTAMIWGLEVNGLVPRVRVYDAQANPVPAEVLVGEAGTYVVQVAAAVPGATYYVEALAANPAGGHNTGNYFLGIDFGQAAAGQQTLLQQSLTSSTPDQGYNLSLGSSQLFHFVLSVGAPSRPVDAAVRMTIYDLDGRILFSMTAAAGDAVSGNVFLPRGKYRVGFSAATRDGSVLPDLPIVLRGLVLDDPIGPQPADSASAPAGDPGSSSPDYGTWKSSSPGSVPPQEPYSDPYTPP